MTATLKLSGLAPKRDLTGTLVQIAEYDRATLRLVRSWPVGEYAQKVTATRARQVVDERLATLFPDPAHVGTPPLTEGDLSALQDDLHRRITEPAPGVLDGR